MTGFRNMRLYIYVHLRIAHVIGLWSQSWVWPVDAWTITHRTVHCISVRGRNCSEGRGRLHAVVGIALCGHRDRNMFYVHVSFHKRDTTFKWYCFIRVRRGSTVTDFTYVYLAGCLWATVIFQLISAILMFTMYYFSVLYYDSMILRFEVYFSIISACSVLSHVPVISYSVIPFCR